MALVTMNANMSIDTTSARHGQLFVGTAGEALIKGDIVYLKNDGLVYKANATMADDAAAAKGIVAGAAAFGEPVTVFGEKTRMGGYTNGTLLPGQTLYVAATAGSLDTEPTVGDTDGFAFAVTDSDIIIASAKL